MAGVGHRLRQRIDARGLRCLPALILAILAAVGVVSCGEDKHPLLPGTIDPERFPTMRTIDVSSLISDSGITRYKITSPLWLVFDEARTPQWKFPKGIHLEKYDDFFRRDATVDCDSAIYFKEKQLWRLDGYVRIANIAKEKFLTSQLFWDQRRRKIYSDSFIHIEKADRIIEGYGFESDERMTRYRVLNVSGIFPVEDFKNSGEAGDSAAAPVRVDPVAGSRQHAPGGSDTLRNSRRRLQRAPTAPPPPASSRQVIDPASPPPAVAPMPAVDKLKRKPSVPSPRRR